MPTPAAGAAPAVGTSAGASAAGSAVSGAIGLAGSWLQYLWQKKLMDKSYGQAVEQWEREAAYMTPEQQMKRFRDAGLNPDLIYGQMQNTNGSMPSVNTPQAPNVARDVTSAQLAESQRRLNDANAAKMEAQTNVVSTQLKEMNTTFDTRFQQLVANLHLTKDSSNKLQAETTYVKEQTGFLLYQLDYLESLTDLNRSQKNINDNIAKLWSARGDYANEIVEAELNEVINSANLKNWQSERVKKDVQYFARSFDLYYQLTKSQIGLNASSRDLNKWGLRPYYQSLKNFVSQQAQWLPFQMINSIGSNVDKYQLNDDGSIKTDDNGVPLFNPDYINLQKGLNIGGQVIGTLTGGFRDVGIGVMSFKSGKGSAFGISAGGEQTSIGDVNKMYGSHSSERQPTSNETEMFNRWVNDAKTADAKNKAFEKISAYKRIHGIY